MAHAPAAQYRCGVSAKRAVGRVGMGVIASASAVPAGGSVPERTFEAIAMPDARRLYSLALSILRDEGEAEDAVQETLLKAWRSWESVSRMDRPAAWLTRVCVNHCISRRRHLRARGWPPLALIAEATSAQCRSGRANSSTSTGRIGASRSGSGPRSRSTTGTGTRSMSAPPSWAAGPEPCERTSHEVSRRCERSSAMLDIDPGLDTKLRAFFEHIEASGPPSGLTDIDIGAPRPRDAGRSTSSPG